MDQFSQTPLSSLLRLEHAAARLPNNMSAMHFHSYYEIYFLVTGKRRYFVGHSIYDVSPGNLVLIPKMQLHRTISLGNAGYDRHLIYFNDTPHQSFINQLGASVFEEVMSRGCLQFSSNIVYQIQRNFTQLAEEFASPSPSSEAMVSHLLYDILLTALRHGTVKSTYQGESADHIQEAAHYISEHYPFELTLKHVAQFACMEETYFSKRFKALTGFGFQEYLTLTRLRAAEQLLLETRLSMGEIAERCGFSGSNYFGDVFRRYRGIAPSAYRKEAQNELWR